MRIVRFETQFHSLRPHMLLSSTIRASRINPYIKRHHIFHRTYPMAPGTFPIATLIPLRFLPSLVLEQVLTAFHHSSQRSPSNCDLRPQWCRQRHTVQAATRSTPWDLLYIYLAHDEGSSTWRTAGCRLLLHQHGRIRGDDRAGRVCGECEVRRESVWNEQEDDPGLDGEWTGGSAGY